MRISDWSSDVCSSDLAPLGIPALDRGAAHSQGRGACFLAHAAILQACVDEPICQRNFQPLVGQRVDQRTGCISANQLFQARAFGAFWNAKAAAAKLLHDSEGNVFTRRLDQRSEEHTSELQSLMRISYAVFCLKKKKK